MCTSCPLHFRRTRVEEAILTISFHRSLPSPERSDAEAAKLPENLCVQEELPAKHFENRRQRQQSQQRLSSLRHDQFSIPRRVRLPSRISRRTAAAQCHVTLASHVTWPLVRAISPRSGWVRFVCLFVWLYLQIFQRQIDTFRGNFWERIQENALDRNFAFDL